MVILADIVDWDALLQVIWVSVLVGITMTTIYAIAILGATRAIDYSRERRVPEAVLMAAVSVIALAVVLAAVVFGIVVMTTK